MDAYWRNDCVQTIDKYMQQLGRENGNNFCVDKRLFKKQKQISSVKYFCPLMLLFSEKIQLV